MLWQRGNPKTANPILHSVWANFQTSRTNVSVQPVWTLLLHSYSVTSSSVYPYDCSSLLYLLCSGVCLGTTGSLFTVTYVSAEFLCITIIGRHSRFYI